MHFCHMHHCRWQALRWSTEALSFSLVDLKSKITREHTSLSSIPFNMLSTLFMYENVRKLTTVAEFYSKNIGTDLHEMSLWWGIYNRFSEIELFLSFDLINLICLCLQLNTQRSACFTILLYTVREQPKGFVSNHRINLP